jgi:hypothetical protein
VAERNTGVTAAGTKMTGGAGADVFRLVNDAWSVQPVESPPGSGNLAYPIPTFVADFLPGTDRIAVRAGDVGDGDIQIEGVDVVSTAGGTFSATDELILVRADFSGTLVAGFSGEQARSQTFADLLALIGAADADIAAGERRMIVIDDGAASAVLFFRSSDGNATIAPEELGFAAVIAGTDALTAADFVLV